MKIDVERMQYVRIQKVHTIVSATRDMKRIMMMSVSISTNARTMKVSTLFSFAAFLLFLLFLFTSRPFLKTAGGIVLGSVAVSAVSADVLLYISAVIKASFLKLGMCNICKNNIAKMFLEF